MDRLTPSSLAAVLLVAASLCAGGCNALLAGYYVLHGRQVEPKYAGLEGKRTAVVCRPPSALRYRYSGVDREISTRVAQLLAENVKEIDVVKQSEIENWQDQKQIEDYRELAAELEADRVVEIDLHRFDLHNGPQLRQGQAEITITVFDMEDDGAEAGQYYLSDINFPAGGGVPAIEKSERAFRKQFVSLLASRIARHFYPYEAYVDFANDASAYR